MSPVTFRRLLTRGDLPDSDGGLYNPSVVAGADGRLRVLVRREADYTWERPSFPTFVDIETLAHETLHPEGFDGSRIEDCRIFSWHGMLLASHVDYVCQHRRAVYPVRQRLSVVNGDRLQRWDDWLLPVPMQRVEKNWVLASNGDDLFCVYSLDPLIVCRRADHGWELLHRDETGLTKAFGKELHNSIHLVPFDNGYLGLWHFIKAGTRSTYVTGAYWLDAELKLGKTSSVLLDGSWVQQDVYKPGVCYVSSAVIAGETLYLFYGEGDAHTGVVTLPITDLRRALGGPLGVR